VASRIHHHVIDRLALLNSVFGSLALYPQIVLTLSTGSSTGLSPISFALILMNNIVWTLYGLHRGDTPITISSILSGIASGTLLTLALL